MAHMTLDEVIERIEAELDASHHFKTIDFVDLCLRLAELKLEQAKVEAWKEEMALQRIYAQYAGREPQEITANIKPAARMSGTRIGSGPNASASLQSLLPPPKKK